MGLGRGGVGMASPKRGPVVERNLGLGGRFLLGPPLRGESWCGDEGVGTGQQADRQDPSWSNVAPGERREGKP